MKTNQLTFMGVIITIFFSCHGTEKTGIKGDSNIDNTVTIGDNNVVVSNGKTVVASKVDIVGDWDKKTAEKLVYGILNNDLDSNKNDYHHEILNFYDMDYGDKQAVIAVAFSIQRHGEHIEPPSIQSDYDCHMCGGKMSFIEFNKYINGWKIENKYLRVVEDGQWGKPSGQWRLLNIGYNKFGFALEDGGTGQGITEQGTAIFAFTGSGFKEIFSIESGYDDSGAREPGQNDWDTNIKVVKEGTGFYDLNIEKKGLSNKVRFDSTFYYKFDGIKYTLSDRIR